MENIIKRYQNFPEAQKRAHGRSLLKEVTKDRINIIKTLSRVSIFTSYWILKISFDALLQIPFYEQIYTLFLQQ